MFAKVVIFCAALAAAHASLVGPLGYGAYGYGAPVLAAGPYGLGKGLIAAPAVATVSSQRTAINHVAPAAPIGAAAPLRPRQRIRCWQWTSRQRTRRRTWSCRTLVYGNGLLGAPYGLGVGKLGLGKIW
ncbi:uncharacterized protein CEXT_500391 [Caerostris extrusa]|uniref:Uncharacterized protein n=1 Tax=Caerostris extrusa TaxID=172846 RepID=A0AAV4PN11_CAEEX|nr:uncharacterized protein CEXT_500391 [Caerostris extrusa]